MSDETHVTDSQGPSNDDIADVLARTNRGLLALHHEVRVNRDLIMFAVIFFGAILLLNTRRVVNV